MISYKSQYIIFIFTIAIFLRGSPCRGCKIHGTDSGVCEYSYLPEYHRDTTSSEKEARERAKDQWANRTDDQPCEGDQCMPFCGVYIAHYYPVCTPLFSKRHDHSTRTKDRWVEEHVTSNIARRIAIETNKTAKKLGVDEYGQKGKSKKRFYKNKACQDAYKRYACFTNFPRCGE